MNGRRRYHAGRRKIECDRILIGGGAEATAKNRDRCSGRATVGREFTQRNLGCGGPRNSQNIAYCIVLVGRAIAGGIGDPDQTTKFVINIINGSIGRGGLGQKDKSAEEKCCEKPGNCDDIPWQARHTLTPLMFL